MRVALLTTFRASRKEPLAELLERIHAAFLSSNQGEPSIQFSFADAPLAGGVSSVDRVLKRHPQLERFVTESPVPPLNLPVRQIFNGPASSAPGESIPFAILLAIAAGVPRSFPFHGLTVQLSSPAFSEGLQDDPSGALQPGIIVKDSWWVSGRMRSVSALTLVEADPDGKKLPPPPVSVGAILAACGKITSTVQVPFATVAPASSAAPQPAASTSNPVNPEAASAVRAVVQDYRARFDEILERAALPHDLPPFQEALQNTPLGQTAGPKKPVLVRAFKSMGYDCTGGSGTFTLHRRTPANLTVEISLDVGTWSHSLTGFFKVQGLGFRTVLPLPVSRRAAGGGQYPIGDAARWQQIVDNLASLVAELDRTFVPAVEAASGPSPEWYRPES